LQLMLLSPQNAPYIQSIHKQQPGENLDFVGTTGVPYP
jgi:hypothetical protein